MSELARSRVFGEEHDVLRTTVARFVADVVTPNLDDWEHEGIVPRELYRRAGAVGLLGPAVPTEHGGGGADDPRVTAVVAEELCYRGAPSIAMNICGFNDLVAPYLVQFAPRSLQKEWLPALCRGDAISAIAMTEPDAGSDLRGITTTAHRKGSGYRLDGCKTLISNGSRADLIVVVARTEGGGSTLFAVPGDAFGVSRGRPLEKIGLHAQDTVELTFEGVEVPATARLGDEGRGWEALRRNLAHERLTVSWMSLGTIRRVFDLTLEHTRQREAFGRRLADLQATRFALAEMATEIEATTSLLLDLLEEHARGQLTEERAALGKWWTTELEQRIATRGVQLHGGYGYLTEYPVARAFRDARASTLYAGATEVMKDVVGRHLVGSAASAARRR